MTARPLNPGDPKHPSSAALVTRWRSCAEWDEKHGFPGNKTVDEHDTPEQRKEPTNEVRR